MDEQGIGGYGGGILPSSPTEGCLSQLVCHVLYCLLYLLKWVWSQESYFSQLDILYHGFPFFTVSSSRAKEKTIIKVHNVNNYTSSHCKIDEGTLLFLVTDKTVMCEQIALDLNLHACILCRVILKIESLICFVPIPRICYHACIKCKSEFFFPKSTLGRMLYNVIQDSNIKIKMVPLVLSFHFLFLLDI